MMKLSPTLHYLARQFDTAINTEECIDFWYDNINDCYSKKVDFDLFATYLEAIIDEDTE